MRVKKLLVAAAVAMSTMAVAVSAEKTYLVYLDPFVINEIEQRAMDEGYVPPSIPAVVREEERFNYLRRHAHLFRNSIGVETARNFLEENFDVGKFGESLDAFPAFFATLTDEQITNLEKSGFVISIDEVGVVEGDFVVSSYNDIVADGELIPWVKQAVGANDAITTNNNFYIVDVPADISALNNELYFGYRENFAPVSANKDHASAIFSLVAGKRNKNFLRGVNPGQPIVHIGTSLDEASILSAISFVARGSELIDDFSKFSFSVNASGGIFAHDSVLGKALRRLSSRLLILQSAGNNGQDACQYAYSHKSTHQLNDAIMVVSGTDKMGGRFPAYNNPPPLNQAQYGANYGSCVEVWAPGYQVRTTHADGSLNTLTGTSFSAPIVAAIAGRYGDSKTRPIEREQYIRRSLVSTGKTDGITGSVIRQIKYTNPSSHSIAKRIPIASVYSKTSVSNLSLLINEKFYETIFWNAGAKWGSIVVDLGSVRSVSGVRLHMRTSANNGQIDFAIHGGNSINLIGSHSAEIPSNPIAYRTFKDQTDFIPYYIPLSGNYRYIMIQGNNYSSNLAYSEVEVYGK